MIITLISKQFDLEFKVSSLKLKDLQDLGRKLLQQIRLPSNVQFNIYYNKNIQSLEEKCNYEKYEIIFSLPIQVTLIFNNIQEDKIKLDAFQSITELSQQIKEKYQNIILDYTIELYHYEQGKLLNENFLFVQEQILSSTQIKCLISSELIIEFEDKQYNLKVKNVLQQFGTLIGAIKTLFSITSIIIVKYQDQIIDLSKLFYTLKLPKYAKLVISIPDYVQFQIIDLKSKNSKILKIGQMKKIKDLIDLIRKNFAFGRQSLQLFANQIQLNSEEQICSYDLLYLQQIQVTQIQEQNEYQTSTQSTIIKSSSLKLTLCNQITGVKTQKQCDLADEIGAVLKEIESGCQNFQILYNGKEIQQELTFQQRGIKNFSEIQYTCLDLRLYYEIQNQLKSIMVNEKWSFYQIEQFIKSKSNDEVSEQYTLFLEQNSKFQEKSPSELCFREYEQKLVFKKKQYEFVIVINYPAKKQYEKFLQKFDQKMEFQDIDQIVKKKIQYNGQSLQYQIGYQYINEEQFLQYIENQENIIVNVFEKIPITIQGENTRTKFLVEICPITPFLNQLSLLRVETNHKLYFNDELLDFTKTCQNYGIVANSILQYSTSY